MKPRIHTLITVKNMFIEKIFAPIPDMEWTDIILIRAVASQKSDMQETVFWVKSEVYIPNEGIEQNILIFERMHMNHMYYTKENAVFPDQFNCSINRMELRINAGKTMPIYEGEPFQIKDVVSNVATDSVSGGKYEWIECGLSDFSYLRLGFSCYKGGRDETKIYIRKPHVRGRRDQYYEVIDEEFLKIFNLAFEEPVDES